VAFLVRGKPVENEFVVKRLKASRFSHRQRTVVTVMRKAAGSRVAEIRGDGEPDPFWM
jgi:hypothetical protein